MQFGLSLDNVMEYFAGSPFYDHTSIYGQLRMQARFNRNLYNSMNMRFVNAYKKRSYFFRVFFFNSRMNLNNNFIVVVI